MRAITVVYTNIIINSIIWCLNAPLTNYKNHFKKKLEMQSCHNDVRAMTPCFYVSKERASLGLSRAICTKSVASVILEIGRAQERPQ